VVSASAGITDRLLQLLENGAADGAALDAIRVHHLTLSEALLQGDRRETFRLELEEDLGTIAAILKAVRLLGRSAPEARSLVSGFGEVWSARLLAGYLASTGVGAVFVHAGEILTIRESELGPLVLWQESGRRLREHLSGAAPEVLVITGYVARDEAGVRTTLGRNGSDFSASIFGRLLEAAQITIWTDVDGVMSGDPRLVSETTVIPDLSYHEAMELAYFGARIIHPRTMGPAVERGIPIYIRNSFRPGEPGTRISAGAATATASRALRRSTALRWSTWKAPA